VRGIANAPTWLFAKEFASGALRHLFKEYALPKPIYALRPGGRRLATKVRVFIDFMEEVLTRELSAAVS
jgi:DNA-binding transcriptional LysR family regulator